MLALVPTRQVPFPIVVLPPVVVLPPIVALVVLTCGVFPCASALRATQATALATRRVGRIKPQTYWCRVDDFDACAGGGAFFRAAGRTGAPAGGLGGDSATDGAYNGAVGATTYSSWDVSGGGVADADAFAAWAGTYSKSDAGRLSVAVADADALAAWAGTRSNSGAVVGELSVAVAA
jgi:hypothetical protein